MNSDASSIEQALSVSQLNRQIKYCLEREWPSVWVAGELFSFTCPRSGHWYFTLKDDAAQVRCVMFHSRNARLTWQPACGQQVVVRASVGLFEARGDYQLLVERLIPTGDGALAIAFEQLKAKLQAEGLFEPSRKQSLPVIPRHIAIITSPTGAVVHDMLTILARRFPAIKITIIPTLVQGDDAAHMIAAAITQANELVMAEAFDFDVIVIARGGGSMEDLWAFNEEVVARAIAASVLPVVSAVGHEVDVTIADWVADVRAPTPSAAAQLLSPDWREWLATLAVYQQRLYRQFHHDCVCWQQRLDRLILRLHRPDSQLGEYGQKLDTLDHRMMTAWLSQQRDWQYTLALLANRLKQCLPISIIESRRTLLTHCVQRLKRSLRYCFAKQQWCLQSVMQRLDSVSPLATLSRGYAIVTNVQGMVLRDSRQTRSGEVITVRLANGQLHATVYEETHHEEKQ